MCGTWLLCSTNPARSATDRYWVSGTALWQNGSWSATPFGPGGASAPINGDSAYIFSSGTITVTRDASTLGISLGTLQLDGVSGGLVTLDKTGVPNLHATQLIIGASGSASMLQSAGLVGDNSGSLNLALGQLAGSSGTYTLGGGTLNCATLGGVTVGAAGSGTFLLSAGQASVSFLNIGASSSGSGNFSMSGGTLNVSGNTVLGNSPGTARGSLSLVSGSAVIHGLTVNSGSVFANSGGSLIISSPAAFSVAGGTIDLGSSTNFALNASNSLTINDGYFAAANISGVGGASIVFNAGTVAFKGAGFSPAVGSPFGAGGIVLPSSKTIIVAGVTTFSAAAPVVISGGTFATGSAAGNFSGGLQFLSGTFRLTGDDLRIDSGQVLGAAITLDGNRRIETAGGHTAIVQPGGQLYVTGGVLDSPAGIVNNGIIQLASPVARLSGASLQNNALLSGSGRVIASVDNQEDGEIRVSSTDQLRLEAGSNTNAGLINLLGGVADLTGTLANTSSGRVVGRGSLHTSGLTNAGSLLFSADVSDVHGSVTNVTGGKTIITGNATATFYDNVTNDSDSEFRISTGSTAVFFGTVSGLSRFTGAGEKIFEGTASFGALAGPGSTVVGPGGAVTATHVREDSLSVQGALQILPQGGDEGVSRLASLSIDGGRLNVTNNAIVLDYTGASPAASVLAMIQSARQSGGWSGSGLTSSLADASHRAIGLAEASTLFGTFPATFLGQTVDATSVLIRFTSYGDANLDGSVDTIDFNLLAAHFSHAGEWRDGDFNYDTSVDSIDFNLLAANFGQTLSTDADFATVPEPAVGAAMLLILATRRAARFRPTTPGGWSRS
jgi:hypothetical protein